MPAFTAAVPVSAIILAARAARPVPAIVGRAVPLAALTAAFLTAAHAGISGYRPAAALALGVVSLLTAGLTHEP